MNAEGEPGRRVRKADPEGEPGRQTQKANAEDECVGRQRGVASEKAPSFLACFVAFHGKLRYNKTSWLHTGAFV